MLRVAVGAMRVGKLLWDASQSFSIDVNAGRKLPASVGTLDEQHAHGAIRMFSGVGDSLNEAWLFPAASRTVLP